MYFVLPKLNEVLCGTFPVAIGANFSSVSCQYPSSYLICVELKIVDSEIEYQLSQKLEITS